MIQLERDRISDSQHADEQPFVFVDDSSVALFELACRVAKTDVPVLISGPTGAGKEIIAKVIHEASLKEAMPFVAINCAAIPASLAEDMLFGHEKGAFTGALKEKKGYFEQAHGGTLFLDEIGEMPPELQSKLLRVLQEKKITRVGGTTQKRVDVRIVAASNINLKQAVTEKKFREDLYYRLSGFKLSLLPLCQRKRDIEALSYVLIQKHSCKPFPQLKECAKAALLDYQWPGNVRELENLIQRALIMCDGKEIRQEDIIFDDDDPIHDFMNLQEKLTNPPETQISGSGFLEGKDLLIKSLRNELEHKNIMAAMELTGNRSDAAERLGISTRTLRNKITKLRALGMEVPSAYARV